MIIKLLLVLWGILPLLCYADEGKERSPFTKPFVKFGRGVVNIITAPFEIPNHMYLLSDNAAENSSYRLETASAAIEGFFMGTVFTFWRLGAGMYELTTSPLPLDESCLITPPFLTISYEAYYERE